MNIQIRGMKPSTPIRILVFITSLCPSIWLYQQYVNQDLGLNPFETIMSISGHCSFIFLIITLAITPARRWLIFLFKRMTFLKWGKRLSDWNLLIKLRRMLGIYSFYYAVIHAWSYFHFELDWLYEEFIWELENRIPIGVGLVCWLILFVLTITSPKFIQKKMGKWWRKTHRSIYPLSLLMSIHFFLITKETNEVPYYYLFIIMLLLGHRLIVSHLQSFKRIYDNGLEAKR